MSWMQTKSWPSTEAVVTRECGAPLTICPATLRAAIKMAIRTCEECQSIDLAPVHWEKGTLEVDDNWQRLGMDITHYGAHHFLMLTDCGPLCFSIWSQLARQDSASVICQLEMVFFECGPPHKLLTDNDMAFCSWEFRVSIFGACWSSIEMALGKPVTKVSFVNLSSPAPSNPANPANCLILLA